MSQTPPWAKRIEKEVSDCKKILIDIKRIQLASVVPCYFHDKHDENADRCNKGLCSFYLTKLGIDISEANTQVNQLSNKNTLSPIVESILAYMKPIKCISPIKDIDEDIFKKPRLDSRNRKLEKDITPINTITSDMVGVYRD